MKKTTVNPLEIFNEIKKTGCKLDYNQTSKIRKVLENYRVSKAREVKRKTLILLRVLSPLLVPVLIITFVYRAIKWLFTGTSALNRNGFYFKFLNGWIERI